MKTKFYTLVIAMILLTGLTSSAQKLGQLWGVCQQGNNALGTIFSTDSTGSNSMVHYNFSVGGFSPLYGKLVQASNGKLYGTCSNGGTKGAGVIFEYDPVTFVYTEKYQFSGTDGAYPYGSLMKASNNKLYGMTYNGGSDDMGVIYEFDPATGTFTKKLDFNGTNGSNPCGTLVQASNGKLYGMTPWGSSNNEGALFEFDLTTNSITTQLDFSDSTGYYPRGSLVLASNGKLYGLTSEGGSMGYGIIFEYDITSKTLTKKFDLDTLTGQYPKGSLMQASNGKFYGMTYGGGANYQGTVFEYDLSANKVSTLVDLIDSTGNYPYGDITQASNGKLYGMTYEGGTNYYGVLFEYNINTSTYTKLEEFNRGQYPEGSLVVASNGKLYGLTNHGGSVDGGTLFEYNITSATLTYRTDLGNAPNGTNPVGPLLKAASGKFYGLTTYGGSKGMGVLYEYDTATFTLTKKTEFNGTNGAYPKNALIQAKNGKLYGVTFYGGSKNMGVLFEYDITGNTLTKKFDFDSTNGTNPNGALMEAKNGKLYGLCLSGGANDNGVLYEYNISTSTLTKKTDFDWYTTGAYPIGALIQAANGKLYGVTNRGGYDDYGVIFDYQISSNTLTNRVDMISNVGATPLAGLIEGPDGKLYGMTNYGGLSDMGVLYSYDTVSGKMSKKVDFFGGNGKYPDGALLVGGNGRLYGFTNSGGDYDQGVLFEYIIQSNSFTKKIDFLSSYEGGYPNGSLIEIAGSAPPVSTKAEICMVTIDSATGKNMVVWERPNTTSIKSYNIYKEGSQAGLYILLGNVPYNQMSVFVDSTSNPRKKSDIYCITSINSIGTESTKSPVHKTIHLTANKGTSGEANLIWNPYEGYLYRTYKIYRGTTPTNLVLIDSISSNFTSYSDFNPPTGLAFYQVGSVKQDPCYPAVFRAQTNGGPYSQSVSNLKDYGAKSDYLFASVNNLTLTKDAGSYGFVYIYTSLLSWQASVDKSWITIEKDSSKTNANVKLIAQQNTTGSSRVATLSLSGSGVSTQTVTIIQEAFTTIINTGIHYGTLKVYPNPSKGMINIDYDLPFQSGVNISIYDMMGKLVRQSVSDYLPTGNYHTEFDLSDPAIDNGMYYIRLSYGDKIYNGKVLLVK